jgi:hypothetical protein
MSVCVCSQEHVVYVRAGADYPHAGPLPAGVLPSTAPPGATHGQRHAEAGIHAQRHHRAAEAGRGPV